METTIDMVRALATGQLAHHELKRKRLEEKAIQLRAELNHVLKLLAIETNEVERYRSILGHCGDQS